MVLKSRETLGKAFPGLGSQHEIKRSLWPSLTLWLWPPLLWPARLSSTAGSTGLGQRGSGLGCGG